MNLYSVVIDKPDSEGRWAVRKVFTGSQLKAMLKFFRYRLKYKRCSVYVDPFGHDYPGHPDNENYYRSF